MKAMLNLEQWPLYDGFTSGEESRRQEGGGKLSGGEWGKLPLLLIFY